MFHLLVIIYSFVLILRFVLQALKPSGSHQEDIAPAEDRSQEDITPIADRLQDLLFAPDY